MTRLTGATDYCSCIVDYIILCQSQTGTITTGQYPLHHLLARVRVVQDNIPLRVRVAQIRYGSTASFISTSQSG